MHAIVARSAFGSEQVKNTALSEHFGKLRCRKSARRCGTKHISKSKCTKHTRSGPLLEVEMSKKCTPLWREAHFEIKMHKAHQVRTTFWKLRYRKSARRYGVKMREAHFEVKMLKAPGVRTVSRGTHKGLCTLSKVSKT